MSDIRLSLATATDLMIVQTVSSTARRHTECLTFLQRHLALSILPSFSTSQGFWLAYNPWRGDRSFLLPWYAHSFDLYRLVDPHLASREGFLAAGEEIEQPFGEPAFDLPDEGSNSYG